MSDEFVKPNEEDPHASAQSKSSEELIDVGSSTPPNYTELALELKRLRETLEENPRIFLEETVGQTAKTKSNSAGSKAMKAVETYLKAEGVRRIIEKAPRLAAWLLEILSN